MRGIVVSTKLAIPFQNGSSGVSGPKLVKLATWFWTLILAANGFALLGDKKIEL